MKKFVVIFMILLLLCGCTDKESQTKVPTPEDTPVYYTDINGEYVPAYSDVAKSRLSADCFSYDEKGRLTYEDENIKARTGIDISAFQGEIDWETVADDGIDFAMIRIGGRGYGEKGILYEDDKFLDNYEKALDAGIDVGVYFFSQAVTSEEAREEAQFIIERIKGLKIKYPVAYDWEHIEDPDARTADMTDENITECAAAFADEIKSSGYDPIIYFNWSQGYVSYNLPDVKDVHFWLAEYSEIPSFYYDYKMLQFTEKGRVKGIDSVVDINLSFYEY